jgi:hypothetical protein
VKKNKEKKSHDIQQISQGGKKKGYAFCFLKSHLLFMNDKFDDNG